MKGYQLTFFTHQDRKHHGTSLGEWILKEALKMGIGGATLTTAAEGFGHHHKIHSARFFELADQPVAVTMAVNEEEKDKFFQILDDEKIKVFYVKIPIEFGTTGSE